jgi:fatty-acyl-CoA synthase
VNTQAPTFNVSRVLDWGAQRFAERDALVFENRRWSYDRLRADVNAAAACLAERGVGDGTRFAVLAMNLPEYLILAMALARLGAVVVPLNYRLHERELAYLIDHAGVTGFATEPQYAELADRLLADRPQIVARLALEPIGGDWQDLRYEIESRRGHERDAVERGPGDLARILYTSGTTSRPKGVLITHGNIRANMDALVVDLDLTGRDRTLNASPLYHVAGLDIPGATIWYVGGTMTLLRRFDPLGFLATVEREGVTGTCIGATVTHMIRHLPERDGFDLSSVRWLIFGQVAQTLQEELRELFPNARMIEGYGMTEACNGITALDAAHQRTKAGSVGLPHHFVDVRVVDENDSEVPAGVAGEVIVRGAKVSPGYLDDADATASAFRGGWFHTGDVGRFDEDGYLYIQDRLKDMIRSGSENMASSEIEDVIYEFSAVSEAAVVARPHPKWVQEPVAFVVASPGLALDPAELIAHCDAHLGRFKVPRAIYQLDSLPRTASGKVLKRELRDCLATVQPVWSADDQRRGSVGGAVS